MRALPALLAAAALVALLPTAAPQAGTDSGSVAPGAAYSLVFPEAGSFEYFCHPHPSMTGRVTVEEGAALGGEVAVDARDYAFAPAELTVRPGTTVTWTNRDAEAHTVTFVAEGQSVEDHVMGEHGGHEHHGAPGPALGAALAVLALAAAAWRRR